MARARPRLVREKRPLTTKIAIYAPPELKRQAGKAADGARLPLSEWIVQLIARKLRRPDLAVIPRKKPGRPRKELPPFVPA
jgi:hypothetical protein